MDNLEIHGNSPPSLEHLSQLDISCFAALTVLVAGDFMLDEYLWGEVDRVSPEAPVIVVDVQRETRVLGGAGNVVNNLVALGAHVEVLGLVGDDGAAANIRHELKRLGVNNSGLLTDPERRTTRKTRVIGSNQQIVRIDRESRQPAGEHFEPQAQQYLLDCLPHLDAIIISDYGKGVLTDPLLCNLIAQGRNRGIPVVVDPKGINYSRYRQATLITPNRKEAEAAVGYPLSGQADILRAGQELCRSLETAAILITRGAEGMTLFRRGLPELHIPTRAREVFDVSGAGDTVVAVMGLGLAQWQDAALAASLANIAAGIVVGKLGTAPILRSELESELHHLKESGHNKIISLAEMLLLGPRLQSQGKKLVFTNGCFDLLHWGHINFLGQSRQQGDLLLVALDSDASVQQVKGPGRPVIKESQRLRMLAALESVDYVTTFSSEQLPEILQALQPDIITKGSNYPESEVAGHSLVHTYGGRVILIPITDPISTQELIQQIRNGD